MITRTNELKTIRKHISYESKFLVENVTQIKSRISTNVDVNVKSKKTLCVYIKDYTYNLSTCTCENGKHLENIIGDSLVICDEIIVITKTVPTKTISTETISTKTVPAKTIRENYNEKKIYNL